jgi:thymidine kinase
MAGSFDLYIGPMFSGKSSMLIRMANIYSSIGKNILAINNIKDTRYNNGKITTHDNNSIDCIMLNKLDDIFYINNEEYGEKYKKADIILIEELQFFEDENITEFIKNATDRDYKKVIASGLDGDYMRQPFDNITKLIPLADNLTKLKGFCKKCKDSTLGIFTKRLIDSDSNILVGGSDIYMCVCRKHYLENNFYFLHSEKGI